jgi:hypothetical protein
MKYGEERLWKESLQKIYYISDVRLNHKLRKKFPKHATKEDVRRYI